MVPIRSRANCFSLSKVSSSKAINLRTRCLLPRDADFHNGQRKLFRRGTSSIALSLNLKGRFGMTRTSVTTSIVAIALLVSPVISFAQSGSGGGSSAGGAASGPSAGTGSAAGSPNAGSPGAGTAGVSGVPSGPANVGGLNNSGNDPSGAGNSAKIASPPPGTNSAGTANSSGSPATTGSARSKDRSTGNDAAIDAENRAVDRKLKSICRG